MISCVKVVFAVTIAGQILELPMTAAAFAPLQTPTVSATEQVFAALYEAIIALDLPPGAKVSEGEVAKQMAVSRQPVRDAFYRLSNIGLLAIRPQRATLITKISERAIINAVFTRTALEVECLRRIGVDGAKELLGQLDAQKVAVDKGDLAEFHRLDEHFHATACQLAGHAHAWTLIRDHKAHVDRIRYLTLSQERRVQVLGEHGAILDALVAGNVVEAEALLRKHLAAILDLVPGVRAQYPDYFVADDSSAFAPQVGASMG